MLHSFNCHESSPSTIKTRHSLKTIDSRHGRESHVHPPSTKGSPGSFRPFTDQFADHLCPLSKQRPWDHSRIIIHRRSRIIFVPPRSCTRVELPPNRPPPARPPITADHWLVSLVSSCSHHHTITETDIKTDLKKGSIGRSIISHASITLYSSHRSLS